jgi:hypothetical protein
VNNKSDVEGGWWKAHILSVYCKYVHYLICTKELHRLATCIRASLIDYFVENGC